ncbi:MAG: lysophospholipid acyltransferase family protein [Gammaproteobacteria bacterium]|nr:lysophospholipid acyltransferase family protein [Gammaproteobacteria bacterium]
MAKRNKNPHRKPKALQLLEYWFVWLIFNIAGLLSDSAARRLGSWLGTVLYYIAGNRRRIALDNLQHALGKEKTDGELEQIARESFKSFVHTSIEIIRFRRFLRDPEKILETASDRASIEQLLQRVRHIHDETNGCIFVTPHLGNWEVLPHASAYIGVPMVVVARPLDNPYLERLVYQDRTATGQLLIPKRNAMFMLQKTLHRGKSIGLLADQATKKAISVNFFGRKATTTPVPAILATSYKRPIVVVACCRDASGKGFLGYMADPIWPGIYQSEKAEIYRLTTEMNKAMETIIRKQPAQYLWIHDRWKTYGNRRELSIRDE